MTIRDSGRGSEQSVVEPVVYANSMFRCSRVADEQAVAPLPRLRRGSPLRLSALRTESRSLAAGLLACSVLLHGACTDPVFVPESAIDAGRDAATLELDAYMPALPSCEGIACDADARSSEHGSVDAGAVDAGPDPDAGLDPIRAKWVGRFATRSTVFSFDDPIKGTGKLLSIAEIVATAAGGLLLQEEMCLYDGGWSFWVDSQLHYVFVNTKVESALSYDADSFESELAKLQIGYGPTPAGCRSGATAPKSAAQVWLTASCDCPSSEDAPPTSARDCRVTDQEHDLKPGATFMATIGTSQISYRTTQEERIRLRSGYRIGDRLYADRFFDDTTHILDCLVDGVTTAAASCPGGRPKPCASTYNKVELVPINASYSCAQVIAQEPGLFLAPLPSFPAACPAEVKTVAAPGAP